MFGPSGRTKARLSGLVPGLSVPGQSVPDVFLRFPDEKFEGWATLTLLTVSPQAAHRQKAPMCSRICLKQLFQEPCSKNLGLFSAWYQNLSVSDEHECCLLLSS